MRNRSPRSFTVENKSGGRNQRTFIPHRATASAIPRPAVSWPTPAEPQEPAAEPRRILPNLIKAEPMQVELVHERALEERSSKPRRGRPPKAKPVAAEMVEEPIAENTGNAAPVQMVSPSAPRTLAAPLVRTVKPAAALPLGERWKRRLNRWAR